MHEEVNLGDKFVHHLFSSLAVIVGTPSAHTRSHNTPDLSQVRILLLSQRVVGGGLRCQLFDVSQ